MGFVDLKDKRFGRLVVVEKLDARKNGRVVWRCKCDCGNYVVVMSTYLTTGQTRSCGCLKKETERKNLRESYDNKRVDGVVKPLYKGQDPRKDSTTGFRGVAKYYTRKSKELRYRAWITVKGKKYYKSGFKSADDAYYNGRLKLEKLHLPKEEKNNERD
ncbi:hypothetical protein JOD43_002102 [Pullulanibacillus pueri]|uniref:AP2 domain-containing protein n=1 Tax=Pullulanibacillus pueri TaxID=1437324 RepID=A0A8J2ZWE6_9BACL|nr:hypothetical protein [Pullulanibacillus pueri]MBM7681930.1 hypothetical protein [Pullulanibacillus pueri]GGH83488.1 AP2 domain-containing protein [Pullulanibacillus pueri]